MIQWYLDTNFSVFQISGAVIEISDSKSSRGDRVALISGTPEQKRTAENLIQAFIMATWVLRPLLGIWRWILVETLELFLMFPQCSSFRFGPGEGFLFLGFFFYWTASVSSNTVLGRFTTGSIFREYRFLSVLFNPFIICRYLRPF